MAENVGRHFAELIVRQNQRVQIFHTYAWRNEKQHKIKNK